MKYDYAIARGMIEGALVVGLVLALLTSCATPQGGRTYASHVCSGVENRECVDGLAAAQCPNGQNDYVAYRDRRGRLHVQAGCD